MTGVASIAANKWTVSAPHSKNHLCHMHHHGDCFISYITCPLCVVLMVHSFRTHSYFTILFLHKKTLQLTFTTPLVEKWVETNTEIYFVRPQLYCHYWLCATLGKNPPNELQGDNRSFSTKFPIHTAWHGLSGSNRHNACTVQHEQVNVLFVRS